MLKLLYHWFRLLPFFLKLNILKEPEESIFLHNFKNLSNSSLNREMFIQQISKNKRVLHFGFLDSPFLKEKLEMGNFLHKKIQNHAKLVFGIDIDNESLNYYRELTGDIHNSICNIESEIENINFFKKDYDIILFPEVLEHTKNPLAVLNNLNKILQCNPNSKLILTVPNSFSILGFFYAMQGYENVHPDHYFYFSPYTIERILRDTGFQILEMYLYSSEDFKESPGITKHGVIVVCQV
jgi:hypothetical protein